MAGEVKGRMGNRKIELMERRGTKGESGGKGKREREKTRRKR